MDAFCALCRCTDHTDMPKDLRKNWTCPILKRKICKVDCQIEIDGGFGAPDTLRQVCRTARKTPQEVHRMCVRCRHGGKKLDRPPRLVSIGDGKGGEITSGPRFEKVKKRNRIDWEAQCRWLKGKYSKEVLRRMNARFEAKG